MKLFVTLLFLSTSLSAETISNYCGAYASVIKKESEKKYEIFTNASPSTTAPCPGSSCPGITKYSGNLAYKRTRTGTTPLEDLNNPTYNGVVAPNSIINDVFNADGSLGANRMFSRPVIARDGTGYVAVAMVMNGYPPSDGKGVPAWLTSPDGINWTYQGKFQGEATGLGSFGSGMALIVDDVPPRYKFYTDGYGPKLAGLVSDGNNEWSFIRDTEGNIAELSPDEWVVPIFASAAKLNGIYYMVSSANWPVTGWQYATSTDSINWTFDGMENVSSAKKNVSLYISNNKVMGLETVSYTGNCYRKSVAQQW